MVPNLPHPHFLLHPAPPSSNQNPPARHAWAAHGELVALPFHPSGTKKARLHLGLVYLAVICSPLHQGNHLGGVEEHHPVPESRQQIRLDHKRHQLGVLGQKPHGRRLRGRGRICCIIKIFDVHLNCESDTVCQWLSGRRGHQSSSALPRSPSPPVATQEGGGDSTYPAAEGRVVYSKLQEHALAVTFCHVQLDA